MVRRRDSLRLAAVLLTVGVIACAEAAPLPSGPEDRAAERRRMVEEQILSRGRDISDPAVLAAMEQVPRHLFVPEGEREDAYADRPLPIGFGQTISQPYIVALMTELLDLEPGDRVLEIGTGSGYQAAVLSRIAKEVYTIEIVKPLGERARRTLGRLGYDNVHVRIGDGYKGWRERAPFDAILVTAAPPTVPEPLLKQLKTGGKLVLPVGRVIQNLYVFTRRADGGFDKKEVLPVLFVPMTGEAQKRRPPSNPPPPR
jgi:protein-L-isoaspartate(D-aspartate) O-methyltransferase